MGNDRIDKDALFIQWLNGQMSTEELKAVFDEEELLKYRQIIEEVDHWTPDLDEQIFDPKDILQQVRKTKTKRLVHWRTISIAAAILLGLFMTPLLWQLYNTTTYKTAFGESKTILLPDGTSKIVLAPNSLLSLNKRVWRSGKRKINLSGKAYIEVPEPGSFDVSTDAGSVSVLGTRFEVYQFDKSMQTACYEGKVSTSKQGQSVALVAGESILILDGRWGKKMQFKKDQPGWLKGHISFDNAPLKMVLNEIVDNYGLKIELGDVNLARRFTGSIPTHQLEQALKIVFPPLNITYRLEDKTLYLSE